MLWCVFRGLEKVPAHQPHDQQHQRFLRTPTKNNDGAAENNDGAAENNDGAAENNYGAAERNSGVEGSNTGVEGQSLVRGSGDGFSSGKI